MKAMGPELVMPLPHKGTTCGLLAALSAMVNVPTRKPVAVGVKVILKTQLVPGVRVAPQVVELCAKSPVTVAGNVRLSVALPVLVSVIACAAEVVFSV